MKTKRVLAAVAAALMLVTTASISPAHAAVLTYSGTIPPAGMPTMPVVTIGTTDCTSQGATPVAYREYPIIATDDGPATFSVETLSGGDVSIYLMESGWDPAAAFPFCLAGANDPNPASFTYTVTDGTSYVVVVFDDTFMQSGGTYELTIDGPVAGPPTRPIRPGGLDDLVDSTTTTSVPETTTTAMASSTTVMPPTTAPPTVPTTVLPTTTVPPTPTSVRGVGVTRAPAASPVTAQAGYTG